VGENPRHQYGPRPKEPGTERNTKDRKKLEIRGAEKEAVGVKRNREEDPKQNNRQGRVGGTKRKGGREKVRGKKGILKMKKERHWGIWKVEHSRT